MNNPLIQQAKAELAQQNRPVSRMPSVSLAQQQMAMLKSHVEMLDVCYQLAERYCSTAMVPKNYVNKAYDGAVAIQWGLEIGLQPLQSLQSVAVVNGVPTLWGDALIALVRSNPLCEYIVQEYDAQNRVATVKTKRVDDVNEHVRHFTWQDAELAGLTGKDTYKKFPQRMLSARARSHLLRDVFADILKGFQIHEIAIEDSEIGLYDAKSVKSALQQIAPVPPAEVKEKPVETKSEALNNILNGAKSEPVVDHTPPDMSQPEASTVEEVNTSTVQQVDTSTGEVVDTPVETEMDRKEAISIYIDQHVAAYKAATDENQQFEVWDKVRNRLLDMPDDFARFEAMLR